MNTQANDNHIGNIVIIFGVREAVSSLKKSSNQFFIECRSPAEGDNNVE